jgi:tetratricopeptide (TPR) repeat protein
MQGDEGDVDMTETDKDGLLLRAARHIEAREYEACIETLKALLQIDPRHLVAEGMLGAAYAELNAHEDAIACFERVLAADPANPLARFQLGCVYVDQQRPEEALQVWQRSLRVPGDFVVHFHAGVACMQLDRIEDARVMFERAARFMPPDHSLQQSLGNMLDATRSPT